MTTTTLESNGETFIHTSYLTPLQNAQITQNTYFELATGMEAIIPSDVGISNDGYLDTGVQPFLEIIVQPCDKFRFRYKSESGSHGKLRGPEKNRSKTNFPTVQLHNWYEPHDEIEIRASLYTYEENPQPHLLELVGKNCKDGACFEKLSKDNAAIFRFLEVESKRKEEAIKILTDKKKNLHCNNIGEEEIKKQVLEDLKQLNMNCAILCFEAFHDNIPISGKVFSEPIRNLKSTTSDLKITRLSSSSGSCKGGDDIILLCDKINKDDIEIHFYEKDENDEILFKEKGDFKPKVDVHHQVAIAFKTPAYRNNDGATVYMELFRPSDKQSSEPRAFTYIPEDIDAFRYSKKRKYNPAENICQPSTSTFQEPEYISSSSNSSGLEASANSLGSAETSSLDEDPTQFSDEDVEQFLSIHNLVDLNNFIQRLEFDDISDPSTAEDYGPSVEMEAAIPLDINPAETERDQFINWEELEEQSGQSIFSPQSAIGKDRTMLTSVGTHDDILYRGELKEYNSKSGRIYLPGIVGGIRVNKDSNSSYLSILEDLGYLASEVSSTLWNATVSAVSYMSTASSNKREAKTPSRKFVAKGEIGNPSKRVPQSSDDEICAQSALIMSMEDLSIQDKKINVRPSVNNKKGQAKIVDKTVFTDANSYGVKDTGDVEETNKSFSSFKEGVTEIMKRCSKEVYLSYISRLMSVKDENGNLLIHLAVMEQAENLNLMARILKIAPHIVNEQNGFKETPIQLATQKNAWKMALLLLSQGGNPSIVDVNGNNCFHVASQSNYAKSMTILLFPSLKKGKTIPSINDFNYNGFAPLHLSVMNNAKECMQLLLKAGADININDRRSGSSPLHLAIKQQPSIAYDILSHPDVDLLNTDFNSHSVVQALCILKGTPMPVKDKFSDLADWARATLALPSQDSDEGSCSDSSSNSDSEEEEEDDNQQDPIANHDIEIHRFDYSEKSHSPEIEETSISFNEECEKRLCKCLDADGSWRKLGTFVGLDEKNLNGVSKLSRNSSPTKLVLRSVKKLYPKCDKTTMMNILSAADLEHVAEILRNERF